MAENNRLLSSTEAAKALGVTRMTVGRWVKSGRLTSTKIGRHTFIPEAEIERLKPTPAVPDSSPMSVEASARRAISEYDEVLKMLGRE